MWPSSTLQVVLPQLWVPDVGDVVERSAHGDGVIAMHSAGRGVLHDVGLRLILPGRLSEPWRLRNTGRQLGS